MLRNDAKVDTGTVKPAVRSFLEDMPDTFKAAQPRLIQSITKLVEDGTATLPELQWLRTQLRGAADSAELAPNLKNGPFKYFSRVGNDLIHNPDVPTQWRQAVAGLDHVDALYNKNMAIWRDKAAQSLVDRTRAGVAPDAATVARTLNEPRKTARRQ